LICYDILSDLLLRDIKFRGIYQVHRYRVGGAGPLTIGRVFTLPLISQSRRGSSPSRTLPTSLPGPERCPDLETGHRSEWVLLWPPGFEVVSKKSPQRCQHPCHQTCEQARPGNEWLRSSSARSLEYHGRDKVALIRVHTP
jgi:hypothetical protein